MAYSDKVRGTYQEILTGMKDAGLFKRNVTFILHRLQILKWNSRPELP
jgi:hypothetical protein